MKSIPSYHEAKPEKRQTTGDNRFVDCDVTATSRILTELVNSAVALRRVVSCMDCQALLGNCPYTSCLLSIIRNLFWVAMVAR
jgi:hypothetical protein